MGVVREPMTILANMMVSASDYSSNRAHLKGMAATLSCLDSASMQHNGPTPQKEPRRPLFYRRLNFGYTLNHSGDPHIILAISQPYWALWVLRK